MLNLRKIEMQFRQSDVGKRIKCRPEANLGHEGGVILSVHPARKTVVFRVDKEYSYSDNVNEGIEVNFDALELE